MGEFEKAERTDSELDRADEHEMRQRDWDELHGETVARMSWQEWVASQRHCEHHDEPLDGYGKCRECYWQDAAYREDGHG